MEAACLHASRVGDRVLVLSAGKFGERFAEIARVFGCEVHVYSVDAERALNTNDLLSYLEGQEAFRAVFFQACETSTGMQWPVAEVCQLLRKVQPASFIIVDVMAYLLVEPCNMQGWGVDMFLASSQKGFGLSPGLVMLALSARLWAFDSQRPRYYWDLPAERKGQEQGRSRFTPNIQVIQGLSVALELYFTRGLPEHFAQQRRTTEAVRTALAAMGLELVFKQHYAYALTTAFLPPELALAGFLAQLESRFGLCRSGRSYLGREIFRFAHFGFCDKLELVSGLAAVEWSLRRGSQEAFQPLGQGLQKFMQSFAKESVDENSCLDKTDP